MPPTIVAAVASYVVALTVAVGLGASLEIRGRIGEAGLDVAGLMAPAGDAALDSYATFNGDRLGLRRYPARRAGALLLVLLHGPGWQGLALDLLARRLAAARLADIVVPDLRGHGPDPGRWGNINQRVQF